jgi:predicted metal-dependent hydrolase
MAKKSIPLLRSASDVFTLGDIQIELKVHPKARGMTLRHDVNANNFKLSIPKRTSRKSAIVFLEEQCEWMRDVKSRHTDPAPVRAGGTIFIEGVERRIVRRDGNGVAAELTPTELIVSCKPDRLQRAVLRFVKQHAEKVISKMAEEKSALANGRPLKRVKFRDTRSRWGSCTYDGVLSFSWRLIMSPPEVLDYIVSHEAAHLVHMNHSRSFWNKCRELTPHTDLGIMWLKENAGILHGVQFITSNNVNS